MQPLNNKLRHGIIVLCPLCNQDYQPQNPRIVEKAGEAVLVYSQCPECHGSVLSFLYTDILGITMVGLATDLDFEDVTKFKNADYVTEDDVLNVYQLINQ